MNMFEQQVMAFCKAKQLIEPMDHLLVACSGGVDSVALLHFLYTHKQQLNITLSVASVDHSLRGEESKLDVKLVQSYCDQRKIPFYTTAIDIPAILNETGGNLQAICRTERYDYLLNLMQHIGATKLVTAHHADDQAESVLMALAKKKSTQQLSGIYPERTMQQKNIIRPFLSVTKNEIREYLQNEGVEWREDASNRKIDYTRNLIRHEILPVLQSINPHFAQNILALSEQIREDEMYLMEQAQSHFPHIVTVLEENRYFLRIEQLKRVPLALQRRIILILLNYIYNDSKTLQTYHFVHEILALCNSSNGSAQIHLPNQFIALREYDRLEVKKVEQTAEFVKQPIVFEEWYTISPVTFCLTNNVERVQEDRIEYYYFSSLDVPPPLFIRPSITGERMKVKGMEREKRLSRLFIDEKIALHDRANWPILVDQNEQVLAVLRVRTNDKFSKIKRPTDDCLLMIFKA